MNLLKQFYYIQIQVIIRQRANTHTPTYGRLTNKQPAIFEFGSTGCQQAGSCGLPAFPRIRSDVLEIQARRDLEERLLSLLLLLLVVVVIYIYIYIYIWRWVPFSWRSFLVLEAGRWLSTSGSYFELLCKTSMAPAYAALHYRIMYVSDGVLLSWEPSSGLVRFSIRYIFMCLYSVVVSYSNMFVGTCCRYICFVNMLRAIFPLPFWSRSLETWFGTSRARISMLFCAVFAWIRRLRKSPQSSQVILQGEMTV